MDEGEERTHGSVHLDELEPAVELGNKVCRSGEGDGGDSE